MVGRARNLLVLFTYFGPQPLVRQTTLVRTDGSSQWNAKSIYIAQTPLDNTIILGNLCECRHKQYIAKTRFFVLHFYRRQCKRIVNQFDVIGPESYRIGWNNAKWRPLRRSRSFKVTDFDTNRKPIYDFLLVINNNLQPILHNFQVIITAQIIGSIYAVDRGYLSLTRSFLVNSETQKFGR